MSRGGAAVVTAIDPFTDGHTIGVEYALPLAQTMRDEYRILTLTLCCPVLFCAVCGAATAAVIVVYLYVNLVVHWGGFLPSAGVPYCY